ncbi:MAG: hypothetical protein ACODAD_09570, partial [Planctomycetota bacterium]
DDTAPALKANQPDSALHWHFHQQKLASHYWLALAVETRGGVPPAIRIYRGSPADNGPSACPNDNARSNDEG